MHKLSQRFEVLKRKVFENHYLDANATFGPHYLFTYSHTEEFFVRQGVKDLLAEAKKHNMDMIEINLFDLFIKVFEEDIESVFELANDEGIEELLDAVSPVLSDSDALVDTFKEMVGEDKIALITGVGTAHPLLHSSGLMKRLRSAGYRLPIILFYPGTFNGTQLKLFDLLDKIEDDYQINPIA